MSKASEWAERYRKADESQGFTWERIRKAEDERPHFMLSEGDHVLGTASFVASVTEDAKLAVGVWPHIERDRALAFAAWILDTFGDAP